jgi:hypothetical protein
MSEQDEFNVLQLAPSQIKKISTLLPPTYHVDRLGHKRPRSPQKIGSNSGNGRKKANGFILTERDVGIKTGGIAA